ncbi:helix-turn-helix domain-containing protein, partial [Acinetobacter baumannii]|uniref:helix-turn-helix domain-containing protein n=1 Tax=Acinetobacter baumannii TaxID=470 RepID=UPI003393BEFF
KSLVTTPVKTDLNRFTTEPSAFSEDGEGVHQSIEASIQYIEKNIRRTISLSKVAQEVFLSPSYLSRIFKKVLDVNFIDYVNNRKIAIASEKLALTKLPVNYIANQIGFSQTSYFTKIFKQRTGLTPSEY